jgi:Bacteriophage HK97-gp10, putative tail-component
MPLDYAAIERMLSAPEGMVDRYIHRFATVVEYHAKRAAPKRTGALRKSIAVRRAAAPATFDVVANVPYALFVEKGTRPHMIYPHLPRQYIKFNTRKGVQIARFIKHPGTKPRPFMSVALARAVRARKSVFP